MQATQPNAARRRLEWRCRRGTKELDLLLEAFMRHQYDHLDAHERRWFDRLLQCTDAQLQDWLCAGASPDDEGIARIVQRILSAD